MMGTILLALSMLMQGQIGGAKPSELIALLSSADRMKRYEAAVALAKLPRVPENALDAIVGYLKLEVTQAMVPEGGRAREGGKPLVRLPVLGDEITLSRIKANPSTYVERPFILVGAATMSDYYNYGFTNAVNDYYSLSLTVAAKNGQLGEVVSLYMFRFDGAALAERITRVEEREQFVGMAVRLRCVIHRDRLESDLSKATESIEVIDWQVLSDDAKSWMPWTFEGIGLGYTLMSKAGKASVSTCLAIILDEQEFQNPKIDAMLKGTAIEHLLALPMKDRSAALKQVATRARRAKSATAKNWARRAYRSLEAGRIVL